MKPIPSILALLLILAVSFAAAPPASFQTVTLSTGTNGAAVTYASVTNALVAPGDQTKALRGDGSWGTVSGGGTVGTLVTNTVLTTGQILAVGSTATNPAAATSANLTNALGHVFQGTGDMVLSSVTDGKQPLASTLTALATNTIAGTGTIPLTSVTDLLAPKASPALTGQITITNSSTNLAALTINGAQGHGTNPVVLITGGDLTLQFDDNTVAGINPRGIVQDYVDNTPHSVHFMAYKARGTRASKLVLQSGDFLGGLVGNGYDGTSYIQDGAMAWFVNSAPATGIVPTTWYVSTMNSAGSIVYSMLVSSNRVGLGEWGTTATSLTNLSPQGTLHVRGDSSFLIHDNASASTAAAAFVGRKSRGTTLSPTQALANDGLVSVLGRGYTDASAFSTGNNVAMVGWAAENFTASAQGTYITLETTPIGSTTRAERMRIKDTGGVGIGTTTPTSTLHVAGSAAYSIATGTAFTLTGTNEYYMVNVDAQTVTLPTAVGILGRTYTIKCIAPATTATVATTSSQVIDGSTTYSLSASNKFVTVISDNAKWLIVGSN